MVVNDHGAAAVATAETHPSFARDNSAIGRIRRPMGGPALPETRERTAFCVRLSHPSLDAALARPVAIGLRSPLRCPYGREGICCGRMVALEGGGDDVPRQPWRPESAQRGRMYWTRLKCVSAWVRIHDAPPS